MGPVPYSVWSGGTGQSAKRRDGDAALLNIPQRWKNWWVRRFNNKRNPRGFSVSTPRPSFSARPLIKWTDKKSKLHFKCLISPLGERYRAFVKVAVSVSTSTRFFRERYFALCLPAGNERERGRPAPSGRSIYPASSTPYVHPTYNPLHGNLYRCKVLSRQACFSISINLIRRYNHCNPT